MRHGIILNKIVTTNTVFTAYTVSPSRPDGNKHDPTCAAKVTLVDARRLSFSLNHKPRLTAQQTNGTVAGRERSESPRTHQIAHNVMSYKRMSTTRTIARTCETREASKSKRCGQTRETFHDDVLAMLTCITHIHKCTLKFQTSQLPNMVASTCMCHARRGCANACVNVKTSCVPSIKSLSKLASWLFAASKRASGARCGSSENINDAKSHDANLTDATSATNTFNGGRVLSCWPVPVRNKWVSTEQQSPVVHSGHLRTHLFEAGRVAAHTMPFAQIR